MRRLRRTAQIALVIALVLPATWSLASPLARAYERGTVEGDPSTPLAWTVRELSVRIAYDTSEDVSSTDVRATLGRSLASWTGAGACTDIVLFDEGAPSALRTNLMGGAHDGENRIVFREDAWPIDLGPDTLAITTLVYRRSTGQILDADIDLNAVDLVWSIAPEPALGATDLENTATHEIGHLLGFAHVPDREATMFARSDPGDVAKRDLSPDDVLAVCEVYPAGRRTPGGTGARPPLTSGCAAGAARVPAHALIAALGLALVITAARRRRGS
ncbi:MAG: matrixin family metalloprotease [Myxococcota bacterium]|nr:matrixin family metalloprotease [Myxococcota bacterium]